MKISVTMLLGLLLLAGSVSAADFDPGYAKAFGYGALMASCGGYPAAMEYTASQFKYKDGVFYVKGGEGARVDFRAILPRGATYGQKLAAFKKGKASLLKTLKEDLIVWRIWVSHNYAGEKIATTWPVKLTDEPKWAGPQVTQNFNLEGETLTWTTSGWDWSDSDLGSDFKTWLEKAKPGYRFYVTMSVGFKRDCPELKQTSREIGSGILKEMTPIAYEVSTPIAACTVEVE